MIGLYFYCIRNFSDVGKFKAKGIDGKSEVFSIHYKNIEAIVSNIDVQKFNTKEIAEKAKEDVNWIIKHANEHEKVIEQAMGKQSEIKNLKSEIRPVIPMKFGTIFKTEKNLDAILKKNYQKFKNILKNLDGKEEWGVKVYVDEKKLGNELKNKDGAIKVKIDGAKELLKGADYFQELEAEDMIRKTMRQEIDKQSDSFLKKFKKIACETKENKILAKEITGKSEPMVLNSACLVRKKSVKDFIKQIDDLKSGNPAFIFECTGPWPPYNFI